MKDLTGKKLRGELLFRKGLHPLSPAVLPTALIHLLSPSGWLGLVLVLENPSLITLSTPIRHQEMMPAQCLAQKSASRCRLSTGSQVNKAAMGRCSGHHQPPTLQHISELSPVMDSSVGGMGIVLIKTCRFPLDLHNFSQTSVRAGLGHQPTALQCHIP